MSFTATYDACVLHPLGCATSWCGSRRLACSVSPTTVARVVQEQAAALTQPRLSVAEVLDRSRSGLPRAVAGLRHM